MNQNSSGYSMRGNSNPLTSDEIDPVYMCVGDTYFNKYGIPGSNLQLDYCPRFMGTRCAKQWDNMCDAYLYGSDYDSGGFKHVNKEFLAEVAKAKYCRLASDAPGAHCANRCESFLPINGTSVQICENIGTQNWLDTKDEQDLAGDFPQSARLSPISPIYLGYCPETCDASTMMNPDMLTDQDEVLNKCLANGACENVLMDLAYNIVKNNDQGKVTNQGFLKLIDLAKLDVPINVNTAAKIAINYGIPGPDALTILKDATEGGVSNIIPQATKEGYDAMVGSINPGSMNFSASRSSGPVSPMSGMRAVGPVQPMNNTRAVVQPMVGPVQPKSREHFLVHSSNSRMLSLCFFLIVFLIAGLIIYKKRYGGY